MDRDELLAQIDERRQDQAFMARLRERMAVDGPLLSAIERGPALREQSWDLLAEALAEIVYTRDPVPGDRFRLVRDDASNYAVLYVFTLNWNTYRPEETRHTRHEFVVPVATYHKAAWTRWVFDRIASIELHETCESFQIPGPDGALHRPYAPHHGNGEDPYAFWPGGTAEQKALAPGEAGEHG